MKHVIRILNGPKHTRGKYLRLGEPGAQLSEAEVYPDRGTARYTATRYNVKRPRAILSVVPLEQAKKID